MLHTPPFLTTSKNHFFSLLSFSSLTPHPIVASYLIWLGDFNYRLTLGETDAKSLIEKKEYAKALQYDQLTAQRLARKAFGGFEEAPINFHPSYKYDPGTDTFDSRFSFSLLPSHLFLPLFLGSSFFLSLIVSEKRRAPAWCDRILWRAGDKLENLTYTCHMDLKTSDHKPVSAVFEASKVKIFSPEKMAEIQMEMVRELDKFENECMPDASLSENHLDFGHVKYLLPSTKGVVLENTGQVSFFFLVRFFSLWVSRFIVWRSLGLAPVPIYSQARRDHDLQALELGQPHKWDAPSWGEDLYFHYGPGGQPHGPEAQ